MKTFRNSLITFLLLICSYASFSQQIGTIISCDHPVTINGAKLFPKVAVGKVLKENDVISANDGQVKLGIEINKSSGVIMIPNNKNVRAGDILNSSYFKIAPEDSYKALIIDMWDYFMHSHESPENYHKRYLNEHGGIKKGGEEDILASHDYRNELRSGDESKLKKIGESFAKAKITDSTVFYVLNGVFYEQHNYLWFAYENYQKAYEYQKKIETNSEAVRETYRQFLYRMGRVEEGKKIK